MSADPDLGVVNITGIERRPQILVMIGAFWPGNDASGPNQSFKALAGALSQAFDFRLVARDGPVKAAAGTAADLWVDLGFAKARYCRVGPGGAVGLRRLLCETPHDLLWLNGMFDREFTLPALALARLGLVPRKPMLLSPRGEFAAGALGPKGGRKRLFLACARRLALWRGVTLHATSESEVLDIHAELGAIMPVAVAPNLREAVPAPRFVPPPTPALRIAVVGRIVPVKRLDFALDVLMRLAVPVDLAIYGPAEDAAYWRRCQARIAALPAHVRATWHGEAANAAILAALARTDLFFLPTAGENFGHAIFEALACGVPVLISDRTPWRDLAAAQAGWDLPLDEPERFAAAIETFSALPAGDRAQWRAGAAARAARWLRESEAAAKTLALLRTATAGAAVRNGKAGE